MKRLDYHLLHTQAGRVRAIQTSSDNHNRGEGMRRLPLLAQSFQKRIAIHARHSQVQENNGGITPLTRGIIHPVQCLLSLSSLCWFVPIKYKRPGYHIANGRVIVYHKNDWLTL